ncbi:MAG: sulfatase-like hydrolase/transferase [Bacteroidales bacterium]|nr:sulfatase-like hydrolase/transferase [Bacteroidales bacterium]
MKFLLSRIYYLLIKILILVVIFQICRVLFFLFNINFFSHSSSILKSFLWGTRFDLWVIIFFNAPILLIPYIYNIQKVSFYSKFEKLYIITVNSILVLFNLIDIEYYKFTLKRSTFDLFNLIFTGNDTWVLLPRFILDFWYIPLGFILIIMFLNFLYKQLIQKINLCTNATNNFLNLIYLIITFIIISGIFFIIIRGTKLRPVNLMSASLHAPHNLTALTLNTVFSMAKTFNKEEELKHKYFISKDLKFNYIKIIKSDSLIFKQKPNIIIIILESFSKEHIGFFNNTNKNLTPFLDSLLKHSLNFKYSYANGRKSMESLPSILAGLPSLTVTPYIFSKHASNNLEALPTILKKYGYTTAFFHGGTNGTMGFDVFASMAGIDNYYGRWQYPSQKDYDGYWGIWDEPFLQFTKKVLDTFKQPFFSVIYTLTSHHPFLVPEKYKKILPKGNQKIHQSIAYTDYALRKFFHSAKNSRWFNNTLFIITADHTYCAENPYYYSNIGAFSVPIAFYSPSINLSAFSKYTYHRLIQHCDIFPTICFLININDTIITFGKNVFDSTECNYTVNFINNYYILQKDDFAYTFDGNKSMGLYNFKNDSMLNNNLINLPQYTPIKNTCDSLLKSILQIYEEAIVNNKLSLKNIKYKNKIAKM